MASSFDPDANLTDAQMDLLGLILYPFSERLREPDWPLWGWVQRQFEQDHPRQSAFSTLAGMPTVAPTYAGSKPYGLIWRSDWNTTEPLQNEAVGLTIMGLAYLGSRDAPSRRIADGLVKVLRDVAIAEGRITVTPTSVNDEEFGLGDFTSDFRLLSPERPFTLTHHAIGRLLQREYGTPLTLVYGAEGWTVRLRSNGLRRYLSLENSADYADFINQSDQESRFAPEPVEVRAATVAVRESPTATARIEDYDPELWAYVRRSVEVEDWGKVPAQVAIFVEDKVRRWSGIDRGVVGHAVYAKALAEGGALALGNQKAEEQGWFFLGAGLAKAIGNVDRHHVEDRVAAKLYALGVLGLGSLLLTQLRLQHPDLTA